MQNSLLVGLSRQIALRRELDVVANNVANMNTNGFKAQSIVYNDFTKSRASAEAFKPKDRPIHFVIDKGTIQNFSSGPIEQTGGTFHVALKKEAQFFVVQTSSGERYTRAGNFERNSEGKLVTLQGDAVQSTSGELNFTADETDVTIAQDGTITTNLGGKGKLKVVEFGDVQKLENVGDNYFRATSEPATETLNTNMMQGYLELSNVRPVKELSRMIEVNRAYASLASMMEKMNEQHKSAIEKLGNARA